MEERLERRTKWLPEISRKMIQAELRLYDLCVCPSATLPTCKEEAIQEHKSSLKPANCI